MCRNHLFSSSARKQHCWQAKTIQPLEQLSARPLQRYTQSSQHSLLFIVGPSSARRTTSLSSTTACAHDDTERRIDGRAAPLAHPRVCTLNSQNSSKGVFFTTLVRATVISFPANETTPSPETRHPPTLAVDLPVECPPDYVFVEYDRLRARRHGAQDRRTRCPSRASSRLHAQLTKLFERCLFYYTGQSHRDIFPGKRNHAVTGDKTPTHAGGRSARRVPAGLRLCRVRPPACTTTRSVVL